jgi:hypothetical protein
MMSGKRAAANSWDKAITTIARIRFQLRYGSRIEKVLDLLVQESPENCVPCLFASCLDDVSVTRDYPIKVPTSNKFRMFTSSS